MDPGLLAFVDRLQELHREMDRCLADLPAEALDWTPGPEMNSLAVLASHIAGAERFWIGEVAGNEPSSRVRAQEFETTGLDVATLQARLADALAHSETVLARLTPADFGRECRSPNQEQTFTVAWVLFHALEHGAVHLGHMQMIRQLWDQRPLR